LICHFTDTHGLGGAERSMLSLIRELSVLGREQAVMLHPHAPAALREEASRAGAALWTVGAMPDGLQGARRVPAFVRTLRRRAPTVFHAHLTWPLACKFPLAGALIARVPAVIATEQLMLDFPFAGATRLQHRLIAGGVDAFVAVSAHVADSLTAMGWPAHKLTVIPNSVDVDRFAAAAPVTRTAGDPASIVCVARLDPQKGHRYLLQSLVGLEGVVCRLVGDGPERAALERLAADLGVRDRVQFLGDREDVPRLLAGADLFVLPSLYEGLPLSILEAMAARRPVIASAIGGVDEVVETGRNGLLVPPADADALARAVRRLLDSPELAARLADAGRELVARRYRAAAMAQDVAEVYRQALGRY
jgi:glycosyltransferase involved in cell wall biosynthesis